MPWKSIEKRREYQRRYRVKNMEMCRAKSHQYYLRTKTRRNAISKAYYRAHKKEMAAYSKRWWKENRVVQLTARREHRNNLRKQVLQLIGNGRCAHCGCTDWRVLQLDHIKGDGFKVSRKRGYRGGNLQIMTQAHVDKIAARNIQSICKRLQILCANCNWIKRYERQETGWGKFRV